MSADRVDNVQQWGVRNAGVWIPVAVAAVVLAFVAVAGWLAFRWFEDGMSGVYVTEDAGEAVRIAGVMGVRLDVGDVEYGEVTSQFQGWPMAYLFVKADNASARDAIIRNSRARCHASSPEDFAKLRTPTRHGPLPAASLRTSVADGPRVSVWRCCRKLLQWDLVGEIGGSGSVWCRTGALSQN